MWNRGSAEPLLKPFPVDLVDPPLPRLAALAGSGRVLVPSSPDPALRTEIGAIRRAAPDLEIVEIEETPFVTLANTPDLGRFFRYWNKAKKSALRPRGI